MKILIVGLGLIGGSYALRLKEKGHTVFGVARRDETIKYALEHKMVDKASKNLADFIDEADLLVIGLYPKDIIPYMEKNRHLFKKDLLITDICGIKKDVVYQATSLAKPAKFIGSHPMAGKEKSGIEYASSNLFEGANFLITPTDIYEEKDMAMLKLMATDLGFKNIAIISPEHHDSLIAYTSQLTHAIAVSLVNSDSAKDTKNFIGDSYRDLTRIAKINAELWSQLFCSNKEFLIQKIEDFEHELDKLKTALLEENLKDLKQIFINSKEHRESLE